VSTRPSRLRGRGVVRDPDEDHRASSPLELLFDLTAVVAVGRAAAGLHHELAADHLRDAILGYAGVFFAVWWAWMNFTWFASAHDSDDVPYRLLTLVQMAGVLVLAAGATDALENDQFLAVTIGYGIMRLGLVGGWLRVARDEPSTRVRAQRYAVGITVLQVLWFARLTLPDQLQFPSLVVLALCELSVPIWAERAVDRPIFHPRHIEERYGLFTIIVLGESILSATTGIQAALDETGLTAQLLTIGVSGLVLAFAAWWIYFDHPGHLSPTPDLAFRWGYAHVAIFASLAAMGAGLHLASEASSGHADERTAALALALPTAGYLLGLALVMTSAGIAVTDERVFPKLGGASVLVVIGVTTPLSVAVVACAAVMAFLTTTMVLAGPPEPPPGHAEDTEYSTP
jgi:low temperature requirement protein LtrA